MSLSPENRALLLRHDAGFNEYGIDCIAFECSEDSFERLLNAARAEGSAVPLVEGWVMVPRAPTPEMIGAFWRVKNSHHFHDEPAPTDTSDYAAYRAMIAAAPLMAEDFSSVSPTPKEPK